MSGPYETEREARQAAMDAAGGPENAVSAEANRRLLEEACTAAGVTLGAYDHRILLWLAGYEPATAAVVAGLITRAGERRESAEYNAGLQAMKEAIEAAVRAYLTELGFTPDTVRVLTEDLGWAPGGAGEDK